MVLNAKHKYLQGLNAAIYAGVEEASSSIAKKNTTGLILGREEETQKEKIMKKIASCGLKSSIVRGSLSLLSRRDISRWNNDSKRAEKKVNKKHLKARWISLHKY